MAPLASRARPSASITPPGAEVGPGEFLVAGPAQVHGLARGLGDACRPRRAASPECLPPKPASEVGGRSRGIAPSVKAEGPRTVRSGRRRDSACRSRRSGWGPSGLSALSGSSGPLSPRARSTPRTAARGSSGGVLDVGDVCSSRGNGLGGLGHVVGERIGRYSAAGVAAQVLENGEGLGGFFICRRCRGGPGGQVPLGRWARWLPGPWGGEGRMSGAADGDEGAVLEGGDAGASPWRGRGSIEARGRAVDQRTQDLAVEACRGREMSEG